MTADYAYFDYAATAPCEPQVAAQLAADLTAPWVFANAGATYQPALESRRRLEDARAQLAAAIGADPREIVFTSGATEADNLALKGALGYHGVKQPHLITVQTEHKAVLDPAAILAKAGAKVTVLPVGRDGLLDLAALDEALASAPTLVSVMAVNNETGVIQPIADIADIAARVHRAGARLHVDAAQALGKLAIDVRAWDVDMLSLSGHKIGAPVGIGALYVRRLPKMRLQAQQHGGGQERGRRSGTSPVALIRALALAADIASNAREARWRYVAALRATLLANLPAAMHTNVPEAAPQVPHIVNIFTGRPAADTLRAADAAGLALAAGSACSASDEGSHVLKAMGLGEAATQSLRISLSHLSTEAELARLSAFLHSL